MSGFWRDQTPRDGFISADMAARQAGISYRQLHYWISKGVFGDRIDRHPGSGNHRPIPQECMLMLATCGAIARALADGNNGNNTITAHLLAKVVDGWDQGFLDLGEGIQLRWDGEDKNVNIIHQPSESFI